MPRDILVPAHGTAAKGGAVLVAETVQLKDMATPNAARTEEGLALAARRGRPFQRGNTAGANRGASLTRITSHVVTVCDPNSPEERLRARRKAQSLVTQRRRELEVQTAGPVSSAVKVELVAWARATAWAEMYDRAGLTAASVAFAEKASGHGMKALGLAERESEARPKATTDPAAAEAELERAIAAGVTTQ
jgi:hypothetical protein